MSLTKKYLIVSILVTLIIFNVDFILITLEKERSFKLSSQEFTRSFISQTAAVADFNGNLVAHYTFDDNANDSAGSNHGTIFGGATYTDGKIGRALSFDGVDDYVSVPDNSVFEPNNFTVTAWIRTNSLASQEIVTKDSSSCGGYRNFWWFGLSAGNYFRPRIAIGDNSSSKFQFVSDSASNNVADGNWHFIVSSYGSDGSIKTYRDGVLIDEDTSTVSGQIGVNNYPLNIGGCGPGAKNFNGLIDDVRIYNRPLSVLEISELYNYNGGGEALPYEPPPSSPVNGQCGTTVNSCTAGTLSDRDDSATEYLWSCVGANNGSNAFCTLPKTGELPVNPPSQPPTPQNGVYNIKKDGTGHFTTIQACADVVKAGETCMVYAGNYDEYITITKNSGTISSPISFIAQGSVVTKGFWLKSVNNIRVKGFEIDGTNGTKIADYYRLSGVHITNSSNIEILDNYIHHITATGCINLQRGEPSNNIIIKNNRILWCTEKFSDGLTSQGRGIHLYGNNNLVEGNDISHSGTFVMTKGRRNVIRNNIWHDNYKSDFQSNDDHMDGVADDCSPTYNKAESLKNILIENNYMYDVPNSDVKFVLLRDVGPTCGQSDIVIRYNRIKRIGSYVGIVADNYKNIRFYNNTANNVGKGNPSLPWSTITMIRNSPGGKIINNIFYDTTRNGGQIYSVDESSMSGFLANNNLAYEPVCGTTCSFRQGVGISIEQGAVLNKDPQFLDMINFAIPAGSPAVDKGGPLTLVSSSDSGNGTQLKVNDAGMFQDGWAGVEPDWIAVGSVGNVSRIISINYDTNTITLATPLSRSVGAPVYLYKDSSGRQVLYGSAPDIGAYEYNNGQPPSAPLTCTSFTYSAWSTCSNNQQIRTILTSTPVGCTGGTPLTTQSCTTVPILGDLNHDSLVNSLDFSLLISVWNKANTTYDLNADGTINTLDYTIMVQNWTG